ncbi:MAG: FliM/FliN family flagellar motor switch protein [Pseudomonadota bacterium]|nr:FliM/FliN family flagellar motor switch protein [Pseudomonadota bacterium]
MAKNPAVDNLGKEINVELSVVLGSASLRIHQLLKLGRGAVVELDRSLNDYVDIYANNILIGRGEVVITDDETIGIAVTELIKKKA